MRKMLLIVCLSVITCTLAVNAFAAKRWKAAGVAPVEHSSTKILKAAVKEINKKTNNKYRLKAYPANQLGDYTDVLKKVAKGRIELADISISSDALKDPKLAVAYIPSLAATYEDMNYIYTPGSNYYQVYDELLAQHNVKLLGFDVQGFTGLGMTKKPENYKDISVPKGAVVRVPPIEAYKLAVQAMNFETVVIDWNKLYPAMEKGECDGWIGGNPYWNYVSFKDLVKYYIPYNAVIDIQAYVMNLDKWNSLTPEEQKIFQEAFTTAAGKARDSIKQADEKYTQKLIEHGIEILTLSDEETRQIAQQVREKVWPQMESLLGKDIMDRLNKDAEHLKQ